MLAVSHAVEARPGSVARANSSAPLCPANGHSARDDSVRAPFSVTIRHAMNASTM
jgi:hypothetical protein